MKHTILFALLLSSIPVFSQRNVLSDTSFTTNSGGRFFENRLISYDNGESSAVVTLIGDTAAVQNLYRNAANVEGRQLGAAVGIVRNRVNIINTIRRISLTCKTATGKSVDQLSAADKGAQWLNESLTFTNATNTRAAVITQQPDGTLRITIGTDSPRVMQLYEDSVIRIQGYPSGSSILYIYNVGDNKTFSDFSGATYLTRTNSLR